MRPVNYGKWERKTMQNMHNLYDYIILIIAAVVIPAVLLGWL